MNKVFLGLILVVCLLGMALVMLNERLGRKPEPNVPVAEENITQPQPEASPVTQVETPPPSSSVLGASDAIMERHEAEAALAPPKIETQIEPQKPAQKPAEIAPAPPAPEPVAEPEPKPVKPEPKPVAEKPKTEKPKQEKAVRDITRFVIFSREKGATVRLVGASPIHAKNMLLENPTRIVLDLDGDWKFPETPGIPKNDFITAVRVGKMDDKTRVVLDLKEKPRVWRVIPSKNSENIDIRIDK